MRRRICHAIGCVRVLRLSELTDVAIINNVPRTLNEQFRSVGTPATISVKRTMLGARARLAGFECGQVAQVVERSPEKAGVGGSTPSLATISFNGLANQPKISHL
jgi:hypothetical protein